MRGISFINNSLTSIAYKYKIQDKGNILIFGNPSLSSLYFSFSGPYLLEMMDDFFIIFGLKSSFSSFSSLDLGLLLFFTCFFMFLLLTCYD